MSRRLRDPGPGLVVAACALVASVATTALAQPLDRAAAVARALERSPEAAADRVAVREAGRLAEAAGAYPHNPRLAVEAGGDGIGPLAADSRTLRLAVSQELDVHGARGARRGVARAEAAVLEAEALGHAHALGRRTEAAFGELLVERRREALADSLALASTRIAGAARGAARREAITPYTLRQLELDHARAREAAARARGGREAAEATLRSLLLAEPAEAIEPVDDIDERPWRLPVDSLTAIALTRRHDVLEARAREELRAAETRLLSRDGRPGPEIELFVERSRDRVDAEAFGGTLDGVPGFDGFEDESTVVGAGLALPLPFFRPNAWATGKGTIEESRARAGRLWIEARVPIEVRAACDRVAAAQERAAILGTALDRAAEDRRRLETAYREGRVDLDGYLSQRGRLVDAAEAELDALAAIEQARSELAQATGLTQAALSAALGGGAR
jgi:outer membrane protein TolC